MWRLRRASEVQGCFAQPNALAAHLVLSASILLRAWAMGAGAGGDIAIFKDDIPVSGAASSPDHLGSVLQQTGFGVRFLTADQLGNPSELNRQRFDVLVLPYAASFPVSAADNFRKFLHAGGKFLSTGGYAFDNLLERTTNGWRAYQPPAPPRLDGAAWFYDVPAAQLRGQKHLTFSGFLKTEGVTDPGFAHFSVYQLAADGSLPTWCDLCQVRGTENWKEYRFEFEVHPQAATLSLRAGLYRCRGTAWFDEVRLMDERGKVLLDTQVAQAPPAPDRSEPGHWWRSHKQLCTWQNAMSHSALGALQVKLGFEIPRVERLNTRYGRPQDGLDVEPTQLGVFQADYALKHVQSIGAAPMQVIIPSGLRLDVPVEGWAACGVVGWNQARWLPLLEGYDRYGRLRGAVGAMLCHYAGPWAGSTWAFFGVTNQDLFAPGQASMSEVFVSIIRSLARNTYFTSLTTEDPCYRQGETAKFILPIFNGGRSERELRIQLEIHAGEPSALEDTVQPKGRDRSSLGRPVATLNFTAHSAPGDTNLLTGGWTLPAFPADFYYLVARLWDGTNELDRIESGFIVQDRDVLGSGPQLAYHDNYLHFGSRPLFLFGTDDWGYVFNTTRETPLQWLRDMRQRRDFGVMIYENLQSGLPRSPAQEEQFFRKLDGLVQLTQKYGQVYFAGLLIGYNAAASDIELATERDYCRDFAQRYKDVPGLIYYLNGDYRCELSEAVTTQWNEFLRHRYGSDERLREAWGPFAPAQPLGQIPIREYHDWEQTWEDVSAYDRNSFRAWLMRRWNSSLVSGIREVDPIHPTSGEFYQLPHSGVDLPAGIDGLDLANFGFFEKPGNDLAKFPTLCLYNDQRAHGKSGGPGEYGVKTHPAWGDGKDYGYHTARTPEQALELFLAIPHYALGLGASRIHNWCWKDDAHRVFPWGMVYPCDGVPKDTAYVHRNLSLLFRHFAPVYEAPQVYVLTPDSHRLGGGKWKVIDGILTSIDLALATHIPNLGTLNEQWLHFPVSARVVFYPLPFCPTDEIYEKVFNWVKHGGVLYLSGDISYDTVRSRSRTKRLEELCGVHFVSQCYPNIGVNPTNAVDQPCLHVEPLGAEVLERSAEGLPLVVQHRVGQGCVVFTTDPIELHSTPGRRDRDLALYRHVLETGRIAPLAVKPDDPLMHVMQVPLRDGGKVWIVFNQDETHSERTFDLNQDELALKFTVARRRPALVWFDGSGALRAVEAQGSCFVGGEQVCAGETRGAILALDGQDVRESSALLLLPLESGAIQWRSTGTWVDAVVETGEFRDGRWHTLETQVAGRAKDVMQVRVSADQALSPVLVCEKSALPHWRQVLESAMLSPASLP